MLCEIGLQQTMGGQGRCKHARETRGRIRLDEYKKRNVRAKKDRCGFVEIVAVCVKVRACKNCSCCFDSHCASDYIMAGFVLLKLGLIKG
jgi:hypothetical protein